jgi:hypothetical protein
METRWQPLCVNAFTNDARDANSMPGRKYVTVPRSMTPDNGGLTRRHAKTLLSLSLAESAARYAIVRAEG